MYKPLNVLLVLMLMPCVSLSEQSTSSTGDYAMDLGHVYGAIKATKFYVELCAEYHPSTKDANDLAYAEWRKKYLDFIQEIEKEMVSMIWDESKGNMIEYQENLSNHNKQMEKQKFALEIQTQKETEPSFKQICELFPEYLSSERMNLEYFYSEQVQTIRNK